MAMGGSLCVVSLQTVWGGLGGQYQRVPPVQWVGVPTFLYFIYTLYGTSATMTDTKKSIHAIHGMISADGQDITGYVHERHSIGECPWCDFIRVQSVAKEFKRRMEECDEEIKSLNMWSLGTSLSDTPSNRKILLDWWRVFTRRLDRDTEWSPIFRVVETGRRGFLHFHVVCSRYISHAKVLRIWRSITGEASNVHVSGSPNGRNVKPLVDYLIKYLSKEGSTYRWMGSLYGLGRRRPRRITDGEREGPRYGGVTCYTLDTERYGEHRRAQRHL